LEIVLHVGNFLNAGNKRLGDAFGFKLDTLGKLCDTKTSDNTMTVMDVIIELIKDSQPEIISFTKDEIDQVEKGARVSLPTVQGDVGKMAKEFDALTGISSTVEKKGDDDIFLDKLDAFRTKNLPIVENMKQDLDKMQKEFEALVNFFCEDPSQTDPEAFFKKWKVFFVECC